MPGATALPPCRLRTKAATSRDPLLSGYRRQPSAGAMMPMRSHPADARDRHGQDLDCISDCLEALPEPLELDWSARDRRDGRASCFCGSQYPCHPGLQRLHSSRFPEDALVRIEPDDIRKKGKVPKNGSIFFTIFQTFMSGPPKDGSPHRISANIRPTSSTSSSSTNAIAAAPTTKATGAASSNTSPRPCSSA